MAGDSMLREVAALIKETVRDSDTVGRLGGDEFGLLLVGLSAGQGAADRRRRGAQDHRLPLRVEGQDLQHRRQRRAGRDLTRERRTRRSDERRGLGLLRRQEAGQSRARLFGARRGRGAASRRDPVAAAAADGAQGKPLRADGAAHRRDRRDGDAGPGTRECCCGCRTTQCPAASRRSSSCAPPSAIA